MRMSVGAFVVIVGALLAAPGRAEESEAPRIEPRAAQELKRMSAFLGASPRFAVDAEETFDEIPDGELRRSLTNVRRIAVERPSRFAADAVGDTLNRAAWYDGRTLTVLDKDTNTYSALPMPATIEATLDTLQDRYGIVLPLADILYADTYAVLTEQVREGRYLGIHQAAGVPCHHLAFAQDAIEWQIWIDAGTEPLPRKLAISYVREPGEPQYTATLRRFRMMPTFPPDLFTFDAPEGARQADLIIPNGGR